MKHKFGLTSLLTVVLGSALVGCGGDEAAENTEPVAPVTQEVAAAPAKSSKKTTTKRKAKSALDRIDDALDRGNYMGAVDIAVKSGKTKSENMSNLRYVQEELGDAMARGDKKAHQAYQKLNAFYLMNHGR